MEKKILILILVFITFSAVSVQAKTLFEQDSLTLYPNPAKDYLRIELQTENSAMPSIRIIDLTGKVILKFERSFSKEHELHKAELNISKLDQGIYFVKVIQGENTYSQKLLVK